MSRRTPGPPPVDENAIVIVARDVDGNAPVVIEGGHHEQPNLSNQENVAVGYRTLTVLGTIPAFSLLLALLAQVQNRIQDTRFYRIIIYIPSSLPQKYPSLEPTLHRIDNTVSEHLQSGIDWLPNLARLRPTAILCVIYGTLINLVVFFCALFLSWFPCGYCSCFLMVELHLHLAIFLNAFWASLLTFRPISTVLKWTTQILRFLHDTNETIRRRSQSQALLHADMRTREKWAYYVLFWNKTLATLCPSAKEDPLFGVRQGIGFLLADDNLPREELWWAGTRTLGEEVNLEEFEFNQEERAEPEELMSDRASSNPTPEPIPPPVQRTDIHPLDEEAIVIIGDEVMKTGRYEEDHAAICIIELIEWINWLCFRIFRAIPMVLLAAYNIYSGDFLLCEPMLGTKDLDPVINALIYSVVVVVAMC